VLASNRTSSQFVVGQAHWRVAISHFAFFVGVWIWIGYVQSAAPRSLLDPALAAPAVAARSSLTRRSVASRPELVELVERPGTRHRRVARLRWRRSSRRSSGEEAEQPRDRGSNSLGANPAGVDLG